MQCYPTGNADVYMAYLNTQHAFVVRPTFYTPQRNDYSMISL